MFAVYQQIILQTILQKEGEITLNSNILFFYINLPPPSVGTPNYKIKFFDFFLFFE
jgi:hypothetical protein